MSVRYYDWIAHHAGRAGDRLAAVDLATDRRYTYHQFNDRIARLATALRETCRVSAGDRVAILAPNGTDVFELQFACGRLGAIFVPLNWRLANPELQAILADCAPVAMIYDQEFAGRASDLASAIPAMRLCDSGTPGSEFERLIASHPKLRQHHPVTHDDISTILYTSGTTGMPKGAIITHGMNFWNIANATVPALLTDSTVCLAFLPLFHTGGLNVWANPTFHHGGTVLVMRAFDAGQALRLIGDPAVGVTHLFGVPANFQFMGQHPAFSEIDLSRVVYAGVGGAPTPDSILTAWQAQGLIIQQAFGMTETSPIVLMLDKADAVRKAGSAGKPVLHTEVRVVDIAGNDVPPGTTGELWVRGPNITPGYWNKPDITAAAITDGWLHTGDAAVVDADGFYTIVDRWKDMYISGGENVYPAEVENVLYQCPDIAEASVIAVPNERWGEVGRAIVVKKPDASLSEDSLLDFCAARLARYKLPHSVLFIEALPRNATGKVHKPTLRQQYGRA